MRNCGGLRFAVNAQCEHERMRLSRAEYRGGRAAAPGHCHDKNALLNNAEYGNLDFINHMITVHMADVNVKDEYALLDAAALLPPSLAMSPLLPRCLSAWGGCECEKQRRRKRRCTCAASYGHFSIVSALLAAGADVNVKNNNGYTPLHAAAYAAGYPANNAAGYPLSRRCLRRDRM